MVTQAAIEEPERVCLLLKAQRVEDTVRSLATTAAPLPHAETLEEPRRGARLAAVPLYLKGRVQREEKLPEVEVKAVGEGANEGEVLRAAVSHVVRELKPELVGELMAYMRPKWSYKRGQC